MVHVTVVTTNPSLALGLSLVDGDWEVTTASSWSGIDRGELVVLDLPRGEAVAEVPPGSRLVLICDRADAPNSTRWVTVVHRPCSIDDIVVALRRAMAPQRRGRTPAPPASVAAGPQEPRPQVVVDVTTVDDVPAKRRAAARRAARADSREPASLLASADGSLGRDRPRAGSTLPSVSFGQLPPLFERSSASVPRSEPQAPPDDAQETAVAPGGRHHVASLAAADREPKPVEVVEPNTAARETAGLVEAAEDERATSPVVVDPGEPSERPAEGTVSSSKPLRWPGTDGRHDTTRTLTVTPEPAMMAEPVARERRSRILTRRVNRDIDTTPEVTLERVLATASQLERFVDELPGLRARDAFAEALVAEAVAELSLDTAAVWVRRNGDWGVVASHGLTIHERDRRVDTSQPLFSEVDQTGGAVLIDPVDQLMAAVAGIGGAHTKTFAAASIAEGEGRHGILTAGRNVPITSSELDALLALARQAAPGVAAVEILERLVGRVAVT